MSKPTQPDEAQPITPGELTVGDFITVLSWNELPDPFSKFEEAGFVPMQVAVPVPNIQLMGDVLEIQAINLPFVLILNRSDYEDGHVMQTIDLRDLDIRMLTEHFAQTVLQNADDVKAERVVRREEAFDTAKRMNDIRNGQGAGGSGESLARLLMGGGGGQFEILNDEEPEAEEPEADEE